MTDQTAFPARRLETLDLLRALTLVSMILYHGVWDFLYISRAGASMEGLKLWYEGTGGHLWQQSICRTFILVSGFCVPFSRHIFRRGLQVFGGGLVVSAATLLVMYEDRVLFGVLTFLGTAMLLSGAAERIGKGPARQGSSGHHPDRCGPVSMSALRLFLCLLLFYSTRWVNAGILRLGPAGQIRLPAALYVSAERQASLTGRAAGWLLTAMGFPMEGFFSTDYFSLFPWIFLFGAGIFLHRLLAGLEGGKLFQHPAFHLRLPVLNRMGRHSLMIYMLHQPVLYLLITLLVHAGAR